MQKLHRARVLDAVADLLISAGDVEEGARILGAAQSAPFPHGASQIRPAELEEVTQRAHQSHEAAGALMVEGRDMPLDDALQVARTHLESLAG